MTIEAADKRAEAPAQQMSIIGTDIVITGNIEASVDLHIEGRVNGDVTCATLVLGEQSRVVGRITAERVRVAGAVEGAIETRDLAIEATAQVKGDILYQRMKVANGARLEGTIKHRAVEESAGDAARLKLVETPPEPRPAVYIE